MCATDSVTNLQNQSQLIQVITYTLVFCFFLFFFVLEKIFKNIFSCNSEQHLKDKLFQYVDNIIIIVPDNGNIHQIFFAPECALWIDSNDYPQDMFWCDTIFTLSFQTDRPAQIV